MDTDRRADLLAWLWLLLALFLAVVLLGWWTGMIQWDNNGFVWVHWNGRDFFAGTTAPSR